MRELIGVDLDMAVAKALGAEIRESKPWQQWDYPPRIRTIAFLPNGEILHPEPWEPSTNWDQGGPIIERELMTIAPNYLCDGSGVICGWTAVMPKMAGIGQGETPLIAAMRAYVASKTDKGTP